jgi:hypothetical protein
VSRKYQVTLPGPVAEQLEQMAAGEEQPPTTLAGQFVRSEVARAAATGKVRPLRQQALAVGATSRGERARWLAPYGGDADWSADMWGQIVALHGRYPEALGALQEHWWRKSQQTETLSALAVWRSELDDAGLDPREELAFQGQLDVFADKLRRQGGGVTKAWMPGAPPDEWSGAEDDAEDCIHFASTLHPAPTQHLSPYTVTQI